MDVCFEVADSDDAFIAKGLGDIARAKGMAQVEQDAGLSPESLHKALTGERRSGFDTILKVVKSLGLKLHAVATRGGSLDQTTVQAAVLANGLLRK